MMASPSPFGTTFKTKRNLTKPSKYEIQILPELAKKWL